MDQSRSTIDGSEYPLLGKVRREYIQISMDRIKAKTAVRAHESVRQLENSEVKHMPKAVYRAHTPVTKPLIATAPNMAWLQEGGVIVPRAVIGVCPVRDVMMRFNSS